MTRPSRRPPALRNGLSFPGVPGLTVVVYVVLLSLLNEVGSLPLAFYSGFVARAPLRAVERTLGRWLDDQAKSLGVGMVLGVLARRR